LAFTFDEICDQLIFHSIIFPQYTIESLVPEIDPLFNFFLYKLRLYAIALQSTVMIICGQLFAFVLGILLNLALAEEMPDQNTDNNDQIFFHMDGPMPELLLR